MGTLCTTTVSWAASLLLLTLFQTPPDGGDHKPLEGTHWTAIELVGKPTPNQDPKQGAYLQFDASARISGFDGCNRLAGSYQLKGGDSLTFSQMVSTQMACLKSPGIEDAFRDALAKTSRFTLAGDRLELLDAAGTRLGAFRAAPEAPAEPAPSPSPSAGLAGTSWKLVKFQSMDDTTLKPDDEAKYTIEFAADGQLFARIDCNRGHGTWKSPGPNQIELSPMALTRAMCPPGSMHDHIVERWGSITSYVMKGGHLFLALKMDSGIYEFEPITGTQ
jgi:heat shock protein HslJ